MHLQVVIGYLEWYTGSTTNISKCTGPVPLPLEVQNLYYTTFWNKASLWKNEHLATDFNQPVSRIYSEIACSIWSATHVYMLKIKWSSKNLTWALRRCLVMAGFADKFTSTFKTWIWSEECTSSVKAPKQ